MEDEVQRMTQKENFEVVPRSRVPAYQKVLLAIWSYRRKTKPTGEIHRHCSQLCADRSTQTYGIDYNKTYYPAVQWSTVRVLLLLSQSRDHKSRQVDYAQTFPQPPLEDEDDLQE
eukprot:8214111-Ditylum_brightwellii.AAC.1